MTRHCAISVFVEPFVGVSGSMGAVYPLQDGVVPWTFREAPRFMQA